MTHYQYSPVGYIYQADMYCLDCIPEMFSQGLVKDECNCADCVLDRVASQEDINRQDESSFDSGYFPKHIPYHNDLHYDCGEQCYSHCALCHEVIDGPCGADESMINHDTLQEMEI